MTTYEEYEADKKEFYSKITGDANVREDIRYPYGADSNTYCKSQSWCDHDSRKESYGVWDETITTYDEKVYKTMFVHDLGDGVIQETKKLVRIIHHTDIEYYCYGTHLCMKSKWIHLVSEREVEA